MQIPRWLAHEGGRRAALVALALGTAALLPSLVVERTRAAARPATPPAMLEAGAATVLLSLECEGGVFTTDCLRVLEELTRLLETDTRVAGPVRSLARAHAVSGAVGTLRAAPLRVAPLYPSPPRGEDELRLLRARVRADASLAARFLRPDDGATWISAPLAVDLHPERARRFVEALRERFDQPPLARVDARLEPRARLRGRAAAWAAPAFGLACIAAALALAGGRLAALATLSGVAALLWHCGVLAHLGPRAAGAGSELAFAVALAVGACAALLLLHRARAELRRGAPLDRAIAAGLAFSAPPAAIVLAALAASGVLDRSSAPALLAALVAALLAAAVLAPLARDAGYARTLDAWLERALVALDVSARAHARTFGLVAVALGVAAVAGLANAPAEDPRPAPPRAQRWLVDSGAAGGALEPEFLERVDALRRELAAGPGVRSASSLIDAVLAPAQQAAHDGDALFAGVPPAREEVERALALFAAAAPEELEGRVDAERRRAAIDVLSEPERPTPSGVGLPLLAGLVALSALSAAWLRGAGGGAVVAAPAALAAAVLVGAGAPLESAAFALAASALTSLLLLARVGELERAGAERGVSLSLALRDSGRPSAALALAASGVAACTSTLAVAFAPVLALAVALALTPVLARAASLGSFATREPLRADVSPPAGSLQRRGSDARR